MPICALCAWGLLSLQAGRQAIGPRPLGGSQTPSASAGIDQAQERKQTIADIRQELQGDLVASAQAVDWSAEAGWALVNTLLLGRFLCSAKGLSVRHECRGTG